MAGRSAQGEEKLSEEAGLLLRTSDDGSSIAAPVLGSTIEVRVTGIVARAKVTQIFMNPGSEWVEGVYVFPLPEGAAVDTLRLVVGDRVLEGVIQEKEEAQQTYEEAKQAGVKASLLQQQRPDVFTNSVANIGPGETVEVTIELQQVVRFTGGRFSLRFPMVVAPRYGEGPGLAPPALPAAIINRNGPVNPFALHVDLAAGFPLGRVESPTHAIVVEAGPKFRYAVDLADGLAPADSDFVLEWTPAVGREPRAVLYSEEVDGETYALLMVMPPDAPEASASRLPREAVFVIDTSGSMEGSSIQQAREALLLALDRLQPSDWFNVVEFNSEARALFPDSVPATAAAIEKARAWVRALVSTGGTEMLSALQIALRGGQERTALVQQVIFATDGQVSNYDELFQFISANLGNRRLFMVGIGSAPNVHFLRKAAEFGRGTFTQIDDVSEVAREMGALFSQLEDPMLRQIEVGWSDAAAEPWPARVPDLYLGEPLVVSAKLSGPVGVNVAGVRGDKAWEDSFPAAAKVKRAGLDKLWARRKVDALVGSLFQGADAEEVQKAVTELGLRHHLVTDHTSLVAVDVAPTAPAGVPLTKHVLSVNPPEGWDDMTADVITVSTEISILDERRISTGSVVSQADLEKIPTSRDPWAVLQATPGVLIDRVHVGGNESGQASAYIGPGSDRGQGVWELEGVALPRGTDLASSPFEALDEVQVETGGADPALPTPGVRINLVTKRGINEWRGSGDLLGGRAGGGEREEAERIEDLRGAGAELGGFLRRDHAWAWGSLHRSRTGSVAPGGQEGEAGRGGGTLKVNGQLTSFNSATLLWHRNDTSGSGVGAGLDRAPDSTWDHDNRQNLWKAEDTQIFNDNLILTAILGSSQHTLESRPRGGLGEEVRIDAAGVARGSWFGLEEDRKTREARLQGSLLFNTGPMSHEVIFGGEWREQRDIFTLTPPRRVTVAGEALGLPDGQSVLEVWRGGEVDATAETRGFRAQDILNLGRATFAVGLRWDSQDLGIPGIARAETVAPRLGLTYALGSEQDTLLRASASRFASRLGTDPAFRLDADAPAALYSFLDADGGVRPWYAAGFGGLVDPGLEPEITDEAVLGIEHAVRYGFVVGLRATWRRTEHILESRSLVRDAATGAVFTPTAADWVPAGTVSGLLPDGAAYSAPVYDLRPGLALTGGSLLVNGDRSQEYRGLTLEWHKRLFNSWMARGHATWHDWTWGLGPDFERFDDPTNTAGSGDDDGQAVAGFSRSLTHPWDAERLPTGRWSFHTLGLVQLPRGFFLSGAVNGRDGYALPYFRRVARPNAGAADVQVTERVDSFRTGDLFTVDAGLGSALGLADWTLTWSLDAFNVLDEQAVVEREADLGLTRGGSAERLMAPRTLRLTFRVEWR
jgi:Ca-activated chloride channel family protein